MRLIALSLLALSASAQDGLHWFDNYKDALAEARRSQKPVLLEFRCEP